MLLSSEEQFDESVFICRELEKRVRILRTMGSVVYCIIV
jgi:hypothetical protein